MAILNVSNESQLKDALLDVKGGDTIRLASGVYDKLEIASGSRKSFDFGEKVTITSANPSNPAVINEMFIARADNIEIKGLKFDYDGTLDGSTPSWLDGKPFFIENSSRITLDDIEFDGHLKGGYGADRGLRVVNSSDIAVRNSEFSKFMNAVELGNSENVSITGSEFTNITTDGIRFGGIDGLRIENNEFFDFRSAVKGENHKDAIQAGTTKTDGASSNVVIKGNDFDLAEVVHAIYLGNELVLHDKVKSSYHKNVLIEDNYVKSAHVWGIAVLHADGLTIKDNTLIQNPDKGFTSAGNIPLVNVSQDSLNVRIQGNEAAVVPVPQNSTWIVSNNATGTKKHIPTYWEDLFPGGGPVEAGIDDDREDDPEDDREEVEEDGWEEVEEDDADTGSGGGGGGTKIVVGGSGGKFRLDGGRADDGTTFVVENLDLDGGDLLIFSGFDTDTFQFEAGRNKVWVWNDGRAVTVDSALDLAEIAGASPDVSAQTQGEDLILRIDMGQDLVEVVVEDIGDAYQNANNPEFF